MTQERAAPWAVAFVALALTVCEVWPQTEAYTWVNRDGRFYVNVLTTLAERGSFVQDEFAPSWYTGRLFWNRDLDAGWSNVAVGRGGHHYPKHPWALPVLAFPLYWAFGLWGTLAFNLLMMWGAGYGGYRYARAYVPPAPAALAAIALLFATAVREYTYDFHVDITMNAVLAAAAAAAVSRRGFAAGALVGLGVLLRPTTILVALPVALLLVERRAWRALGLAVAGGAVPLAVGALMNWALFGKPWWSGYNRILVVVHGQPTILELANSFDFPLKDGALRAWEGPFGLRSKLTAFALAVPGLLVLGRRRPLTALGGAAVTALYFVVFAKYVYEGNRFQWPAYVMLLPALAATFAAVGRLVPRAARDAVVVGVGTASLLALQLPLTSGADALLSIGRTVAWHVALAGCVAGLFALAARRLRAPAAAAGVALGVVICSVYRDALLRDATVLWRVVPVMAAALAGVLVLARACTWAARRLRGRRGLVAALATLAVLGLAGVVRTRAIAAAPFRLASEREVRHMTVLAGDIPCDFLAWEHIAWECSHVDNGQYGEVGLALPEGVVVGRVRRPMLLVPTAPFGEPRRVSVPLPAGLRALRLSWAVPDGLPGGVHVVLSAGGREVDAFDAPPAGEWGMVHTRHVALPAGARTLVLQATATHGQGGRAVVALDASGSAR